MVRLFLPIGLFIALFSFVVSPIAFAQESKNGSLEVSPAYLEVVLEEPGIGKTFEITYRNNSSQSMSLDIFPIDFKQQGERGGVIFLDEDVKSYSYSLSSFLTFETNHLQLEPNSEKTLTVTVTNRQDLSPGGHYAAIVAKNVSSSQETNSVSPAISTLIFMRKMGGEWFNLSIRSLDWPTSVVALSMPKTTDILFQNEGNIHVVPYGRVEIKDMFGRLVAKGVMNTTSAIVMPESRRLIPVQFTRLERMAPISFNTLEINGSDSLRKTRYTYQETFLYIHPAVLLVLLVVVGFIILRRRRKKAQKLAITTPVTPEKMKEDVTKPKPKRKAKKS